MNEEDEWKKIAAELADDPPLSAEQIMAEIMKEAAIIRREVMGIARDHLREKGGWIEINGERFYPGDIPEEH
jgi:hypothetical protein